MGPGHAKKCYQLWINYKRKEWLASPLNPARELDRCLSAAAGVARNRLAVTIR